jgi:hypothetical protein
MKLYETLSSNNDNMFTMSRGGPNPGAAFNHSNNSSTVLVEMSARTISKNVGPETSCIDMLLLAEFIPKQAIFVFIERVLPACTSSILKSGVEITAPPRP